MFNVWKWGKQNRKWCEELEAIVIVQVNCNNSYDNSNMTWNSSSGRGQCQRKDGLSHGTIMALREFILKY